MINDTRYAARMLLRSPGFTVAALIVLTLGIGATTTMFSATNAVLLRPLPFPDADRLVVVREARAQAGFERTVVAAAEYLAWTRDSPVLRDSTIVDNPGLALAIDAAPDRLSAMRVSADFFPLFGVRPALGRAFTRDAEVAGHGDVLLISDRLWRDRLAGAGDVVGRSVRLEGRPATIIGVLPPRFTFGGMRVDLVVPATLTAEQPAGDHAYDVYARLAPGVSREQAAAELSRAALAHQGTPAHLTGAAVVPLKEELVGDAQTPMLVLFAAVGFVLLSACANIANLLLARGAARQREVAIRAALGAGRGRIIRQLVTESLLLSTIGGGSGALLALWLTDLLARVAAASVPRADEIHVDGRGLLFALGVSAAAGLLFGLAPAWQASRADVNDGLKQESRGGSAAGRQRALSTFVVAEIALALVLLVGAGLLLATFGQLRRVDPGFDAQHALVVPAFLPDWKYKTRDVVREFFRRSTDTLAAVPGVAAVGAVNALPLSGDNSSGSLTIEGRPAPPPTARPNADRRAVTPGYFDAMAIHVVSGHAFTNADKETAPKVVIVSQGFADRYWPGEAAVGKRVRLGRYEAQTAPWRTVIGVVNDVRHKSLDTPPRPVVYYPHAQDPNNLMQIVVRSAGTPASVIAGVRQALQLIDPDLPVDQVRPMSDLVQASLYDTKLDLSLLGCFALMALALSAAGIYGVMAYAVAQRRVEFGIRLALGATAGDLLRLVAYQGLVLTGTGLAIGLAGARLASAALTDLVYGVRPTEPSVYLGTAALLGIVALAACVIPALRALKADPMTALRAE